MPDNPEDMWHVYNLIRVDDHVDAVTFRKVTRGGGDEHAGAAESERVRVRLRLRVEDVAYDGEGDAVRVKGRNTTETDSVKLGAYHTITLEPNRPVKIEKVEWDVLDVDRVRELSDPAATADLAVLLITEGLANLALVGASVTTFKAKVEKAMPRKSGAAQMGYAKALETFHRNVLRRWSVTWTLRGQVRRRRRTGVREGRVHAPRGRHAGAHSWRWERG